MNSEEWNAANGEHVKNQRSQRWSKLASWVFTLTLGVFLFCKLPFLSFLFAAVLTLGLVISMLVLQLATEKLKGDGKLR